MKHKKFQYVFFAILLTALLSGCIGIQGGIEEGGGPTPPTPPTPPPISLPALQPTLVENTRATVQWPEPTLPAGVTVDSYVSNNGTPTSVTIAPTCSSGNCTYIVPNLNPFNLYTVGFRYTTSVGTPDFANVQIDTTLKQACYEGHAATTGYGASLDVGDVNGDGDPDLLVGPEDNNAASRRADLFLGGPNNFPAPTATGLDPWAFFVDTTGSPFVNFPAHIGDVNCDGIGDVLFGEEETLAVVTEGLVHIFSGAGLTSGSHDTKADDDYSVSYNASDIGLFGHAFAAADTNGTGCDSLVVGAWGRNGQGGEIYLIASPITGNVTVLAGSFIYNGALLDKAGIFVSNVGDVDSDGSEEVIFTSVEGPTGATLPVTYKFNDLLGPNFGVIEYFPTTIQKYQAGSLTTGNFYLSGPTNGGGQVYLYNQRTIIAPENMITIDGNQSAGMGVAVGDFYPGTAGDELVVGSADRVYVYNSFSVGGAFDVTADAILDLVGVNLVLTDFNGDTYQDIIASDPFANGETGRVCVYY